MPANRRLDLGHLSKRFLNTVLADVRQPRRERRKDRFRTVGLCDSDDCCVLAMPSTLCRGIDPGADVANPVTDFRKKHSCEI
jgi:hypothetical protein